MAFAYVLRAVSAFSYRVVDNFRRAACTDLLHVAVSLCNPECRPCLTVRSCVLAAREKVYVAFAAYGCLCTALGWAVGEVICTEECVYDCAKERT